MVMRIKEIREEAGVSQKELAARVGVHLSVLNAYEREIFLPPSRDLPLFSKVLDCSIDDLFAPHEEYTA